LNVGYAYKHSLDLFAVDSLRLIPPPLPPPPPLTPKAKDKTKEKRGLKIKAAGRTGPVSPPKIKVGHRQPSVR
jgi:hypothetical protein